MKRDKGGDHGRQLGRENTMVSKDRTTKTCTEKAGNGCEHGQSIPQKTLLKEKGRGVTPSSFQDSVMTEHSTGRDSVPTSPIFFFRVSGPGYAKKLPSISGLLNKTLLKAAPGSVPTLLSCMSRLAPFFNSKRVASTLLTAAAQWRADFPAGATFYKYTEE